MPQETGAAAGQILKNRASAAMTNNQRGRSSVFLYKSEEFKRIFLFEINYANKILRIN